jgi:hypothetical protein
MESAIISIIILIAFIQSVRVIKLRKRLADVDRAFKELAKIKYQ